MRRKYTSRRLLGYGKAQRIKMGKRSSLYVICSKRGNLKQMVSMYWEELMQNVTRTITLYGKHTGRAAGGFPWEEKEKCMEDSIPKSIRHTVALLVAIVLAFSTFTLTVFAANAKTEVPGRIYEFGKDSHYEFSATKEFAETSDADTYGTFSVSGEVSDVTIKDGIPAYEVTEGNLKFFYSYGNSLFLNENEDSWHLIEDKSKKIDDLKLDENILKGAIILQTSTDRLNWVDVVSMTDAFNKTPVKTDFIYDTEDIQLINGCYYRVIIAYELCIRTESGNILFVNTDKFDYKKCVEVYEFYAYTDTSDADASTSNEAYNLGSKVRAADFDSYYGEETITKEDAHYGWDLGNFFVSGYTDEVKGTDGSIVFLKNVGDKVTLWFRLNQDINKLNGNEKLSITADGTGSDRYFETPTMDFGRGTLIIRYTDHNNVKAEPTIYTNYLEANTSVGADTKVQLLEEGDYEVALDYQITNDQLIDKVGHYRIFFKFSIRNGNCMVYPFDVVTGSELTNSSMTENGFRLDLAKSRYLKVNLKREMLTESAEGLAEDTRFNGPARDGVEYTDEGIYTITVTNEYTGQFTIKKIYVGTNNVMKAHMTTGLSIPEINNLVSQGATIADDGTIQLVSVIQATSEPDNITEPTTTPEDSSEDEESIGGFPIIFIIGIIIVCAILAILVITKKKLKLELVVIENKENTERGAEE